MSFGGRKVDDEVDHVVEVVEVVEQKSRPCHFLRSVSHILKAASHILGG